MLRFLFILYTVLLMIFFFLLINEIPEDFSKSCSSYRPIEDQAGLPGHHLRTGLTADGTYVALHQPARHEPRSTVLSHIFIYLREVSLSDSCQLALRYIEKKRTQPNIVVLLVSLNVELMVRATNELKQGLRVTQWMVADLKKKHRSALLFRACWISKRCAVSLGSHTCWARTRCLAATPIVAARTTNGFSPKCMYLWMREARESKRKKVKLSSNA
jgi:hypothetical protein